ncbi:hypothetical protein ACFYO1_31865 [Nocardia sp. NPDC006044]|uniref:hypothetical protein n=1 Tax=Nocardia sp. NPDC006044 TaxID=3364306 RepID=UPI0036763782
MQLEISVHRARLGRDEYRVIRPTRPITGAVLSDCNPSYRFELTAEAAFQVTGLWLLAARSRHSLVHIPLRGNQPPDPISPTERGELDLVLGHSHSGFAPNHWKALRRRLDRGQPQMVAWNPDDVLCWDEVHRESAKWRWRRPAGARLHEQVHAHTLILLGTAGNYLHTARYILDLALWQPDSDGLGYRSATVHPSDGQLDRRGQGISLIRWS